MEYEGLGYHAELTSDPWAESSPKVESNPLLSSDPEREHRKSVHFARAALIFHDRLKSIRRKRDALPLTPPYSPESNDCMKDSQNAAVSIKPVATITPPETPIPTKRDVGKPSHEDTPETLPPKRIRILRACQSILTAVFSLCIAVFQGQVYNLYLQTQHEDAWPKDPNLMPTLLLFVIAVASIVFDVCLIIAYTAHSRRCVAGAVHAASSVHYIIATVKAISFALTAAVCKAGFDAGKAAGDSNDLWGWTCNADNEILKHITHGTNTCDTQKVAWLFAIIQACIEAFGMAIDWYAKRKFQNREHKAKSLLQDDEETRLETMDTDIQTELSELTPPLSSS